MPMLSAGTARVTITPPIGVHLTGFTGRPPSTGVHDDLFATALVLAEGEGDAGAASRVAVVTLDLLGLQGETLVPAIKARIAGVAGIAPERVLLCCSHTHYGPVTVGESEGGSAPVAVAYHEALAHHVAGLVAAADAARRPVTLAAGRGEVRVGINRRERRADPEAPGGGRIVLGQHPEGPLDSEVQVWRFDAAGEGEAPPEPGAPPGWVQRAPEPMAVLVNYACHPVSLGGQVRLVSADFPGVARRVVERLVGGTALYVQGACGDINPSLMGPDWDHPRRLGHALGAAAARVALLAQPVPALPLRIARRVLDLPALMPESLERGCQQVAALEAERGRLDAAGEGAATGRRLWNRLRLDRAQRGLAALERGERLPALPADVTALRLGDAALVANPSELFCEIGMAIKGRSPFPWTGVAGYTDGSVGYLPTRGAYPQGGYEVDSACRVDPRAGELVEETSVSLLRSLQ